jgi:hypothetical protein
MGSEPQLFSGGDLKFCPRERWIGQYLGSPACHLTNFLAGRDPRLLRCLGTCPQTLNDEAALQRNTKTRLTERDCLRHVSQLEAEWQQHP